MSYEIRQEVEAAVKKANELYAERYGKTIKMPLVIFSNKMTRTAGCAKKTFPTRTVVFSRPIIEANDLEQFKARTVWHEIAHIVQYDLDLPPGHNNNFYIIMQQFGVKSPTRCHSYTVPTKANTVTVVCDRCNGEFTLGNIRANKMRQGRRYVHSCGGIVHFK